MATRSEEWDGGYVRVDARGRKTYIIRRSVGGKRYEVSTRCSTLRGAMDQLKRFEADPVGYVAAPGPVDAKPTGLYLTPALAQLYLDWSRDVRRNSKRWREQQAWLLEWWGRQLSGKDLRRLSLARDLEPILSGIKSRKNRVAVLKGLYGFLRKHHPEHPIAASQDPTLELPVPASRRAKPRRIQEEQLSRVLDDPALLPHWRYALLVLAGTGWHVEAVCKFVTAGGQALERDGKFILVSPAEKDGEPIAREVSPLVYQAGQSLLALKRKRFSYFGLYKAVIKSCDKQGVARFAPGSFRHTVATYALEHGSTVQEIATHHRHKDARTTWRYVDLLAVPPKLPTPR